jgi:ABC-type dipeptide/oligopeptide/nickel transport system permease subunit
MQQNNDLGQAVMRGLILGGSIGLIAGWFGIHPLRALMTGFVCGILAGLTKYKLDQKKKK